MCSVAVAACLASGCCSWTALLAAVCSVTDAACCWMKNVKMQCVIGQQQQQGNGEPSGTIIWSIVGRRYPLQAHVLYYSWFSILKPKLDFFNVGIVYKVFILSSLYDAAFLISVMCT